MTSQRSQQAKVQNREREFREDVDKLVQLSNELRGELNTTAASNVLSVKIYKRVQEIAKLATDGIYFEGLVCNGEALILFAFFGSFARHRELMRYFSVVPVLFRFLGRVLNQSFQRAGGVFVDGADRRYQAGVKERFDPRSKLLRGLFRRSRHVRFQRAPPRFINRTALGVQ